jgi:hypothetical protein
VDIEPVDPLEFGFMDLIITVKLTMSLETYLEILDLGGGQAYVVVSGNSDEVVVEWDDYWPHPSELRNCGDDLDGPGRG